MAKANMAADTTDTTETGDAPLIDLNEALHKLNHEDPIAAKLVQLRYFAGLTSDQAAEILGVSPRTAYYAWSYARSWLHHEIRGD